MIWAFGVVLSAFAVLTPYVLGLPGAYVSIGLIIILSLVGLFIPRWRSEPAGTMMFAAFALVTAMILYNTKPGTDDWISVFTVMLFLFAGPAIITVSAAARPGNALIFARLAGLSVLVALAYALYEIHIVNVDIDGLGGVGLNRIQSTGAAIILAFLALVGWVADRGKWRYVYLLPAIVAVYVTVLGESRGPLLLLGFVALVAVIVLSRHKLRNMLLICAAIAIAAGAIVASPSSFGRLGELPAIMTSALKGDDPTDLSANIRMRLYKRSLDAYLASPLTGYGWRAKAEATGAELRDKPRLRATYHLHSDILDFGVAYGIVGLFAYGLLIFAPITGALRSVRDSQWQARVAGTALLSAGLFAYGVFNAAIGFEFFTALYVLLTALLLGFCRDTPLFARRST